MGGWGRSPCPPPEQGAGPLLARQFIHLIHQSGAGRKGARPGRGRCRGAALPFPLLEPRQPRPRSGTAEERPRKWGRVGLPPSITAPTGGRGAARTPGGTGSPRASSRRASPRHTCPRSVRSPSHGQKSLSQAKPSEPAVLAALPPPLSRNSRCLSIYHCSPPVFSRSLSGSLRLPPVSPRCLPRAGDPSLRVPTLQSPSLVLKHPLDIFSSALELLRLRHGTVCASQSKQRREGAATLRMLWRERVRGGGREGVKRVINYPWMWKCD